MNLLLPGNFKYFIYVITGVLSSLLQDQTVPTFIDIFNTKSNLILFFLFVLNCNKVSIRVCLQHVSEHIACKAVDVT